MPLLPLTFGVELEFLFVAEQRAVKNYKIQDSFVCERADGRLYPNTDATEEFADLVEEINEGAINPMPVKLLSILNNNLTRLDCHTTVKHRARYDRWVLGTDVTVEFENSKELQDAVTKHLPTLAHRRRFSAKDWVDLNAELKSRILPLPKCPNDSAAVFAHPSLKEVSTYVDTIANLVCSGEYTLTSHKQNMRFFTTTNATCGMHVHVGVSGCMDGAAPPFPLKVLQHLAYILVQFQDFISECHPIDRRGYAASHRGPRDSIGTNLRCYRKTSHLCGQVNQTLTKMQNDIFHPDQTIDEFIFDMSEELGYRTMWGNRKCFVNFSNLLGPMNHVKRTIEFRQHAGTLDSEEVRRWVIFILALVRAAERLANLPPVLQCNSNGRKPASDFTIEATPSIQNIPQESFNPETTLRNVAYAEVFKYPAGIRDQFASSLDELWPLLELDSDTQAYWKMRAKTYGPDPRDSTEWCPQCKADMRKDDEREKTLKVLEGTLGDEWYVLDELDYLGQ